MTWKIYKKKIGEMVAEKLAKIVAQLKEIHLAPKADNYPDEFWVKK